MGAGPNQTRSRRGTGTKEVGQASTLKNVALSWFGGYRPTGPPLGWKTSVRIHGSPLGYRYSLNRWIRVTAKFSSRIHWTVDSSAPPGPPRCGGGEHPTRVVPVAHEPLHLNALHSLGAEVRPAPILISAVDDVNCR